MRAPLWFAPLVLASVGFAAPPKHAHKAAPMGHVKGKLALAFGEPQYADARAKAVCRAALHRYQAWPPMRFSVDTDGDVHEIGMSGLKAYERTRAWEWTYDGKTLSIRVKGGKLLLRGRSHLNDAMEYLVAKGIRPDPALRAWAYGTNPANAVMTSEMKARCTGSVSVAGALCDAIELDRPGLHASVLVRREDHLFAESRVVSLDREGNTLAVSVRAFKYAGVGKRLPAAMFAIKADKGEAVKPLGPPPLQPRRAISGPEAEPGGAKRQP